MSLQAADTDMLDGTTHTSESLTLLSQVLRKDTCRQTSDLPYDGSVLPNLCVEVADFRESDSSFPTLACVLSHCY